MSEVKLKPTGGGSGSISLKAPTATTGGADFPLVLPADDGTSSQYLQTNGSGTLSWATVSSVVPNAVTGAKDAVDSDSNPVHQSIDQSKMIPLLTAALKEAIARIEVLEAG